MLQCCKPALNSDVKAKGMKLSWLKAEVNRLHAAHTRRTDHQTTAGSASTVAQLGKQG